MRIWLEEEVTSCKTLEEVYDAASAALCEMRNDGEYRVGYVAGPISCDGEDKIADNIGKLIQARNSQMHALGERTLLFTAPFIFTPEVYDNLKLFTISREERETQLRNFWRKIISSGNVDFVLFREGYERSPGSLDELEAARTANLQVLFENE
jgi:hypothetical protein